MAESISGDEQAELEQRDAEALARTRELLSTNFSEEEMADRSAGMGVLTEKAAALVHAILFMCPKCADQQAAVRNVRIALHQAHDAIMLDGKG